MATTSKFDMVFENIMWSLREDENYVGSNFHDSLSLLIKTLVDNGYLKGNVDSIVAQITHQHGPVKTLNLDLQDGAIPPIKLIIKGGEKPAESDEDDDFSVTVVPVDHPEEQKEFTNTMLETIFSDVVDFIKTQTMQKIAPESAVDVLPPDPSTAAPAQPGGEGEQPASALPGV